MDKQIIIDGMSALKEEYIHSELKKKYSDIYTKVREASAESFANLFTSLESRSVSDFYIHLEKEIRQTAYDKMREAGVMEEDIPMVWIRARNSVPAPQARLCNESSYAFIKTDTVKTGNVDTKNARGKKPPVQKFGKWILISGAALEILSWIFIPSYRVWAPIVRGIGIVVIGTGAYKIYQEKKNTTRIPLTEEAKKKEQEKYQINVNKICTKQLELNCNIYCEWLDNIISAVVSDRAFC